MDSIGNYLRGAREERKISIAQVARDTKISEKHIIAMESGDFSLLPAPAYAKGFLKIYAEYLGLDPRPLVEQYMQEHGGIMRQAFPPESEAAVASSRIDWRLAAIGVGIAIIFMLVVGGGLKLWKSYRSSRVVTPAVSTEELETLPLPPLPVVSPTIMPVMEPTPAQEVKAKQKKLEAKVKESVWMKVYADGVLLFQGTVQKGKGEFWLAKESFDVRIAKPRLVDLFLDGKPIKDLKGKIPQNIFIDKNGKVLFYRGKMRAE